jgi:O-antigen ligase
LAYSVARFFWRPAGDSLKKWLFHGAVGFFSAMAIYYSFSRISWLAILLTIFLLGFLRKKVLGYLLVLLLGVAGLSLWVLDHDFRQRALDVVGMEGRVIVWKNSMAMVKDRPLTGVGFGKTGQFSEQYAIRVFGKEQWFASHAHNNFLDALAATGIIGFIAFAIWWIVFFIYAWRIYRSTENSQKWLPAALLIAGIGFQINGLTQVNFYDAKSQHSLCLWAGLVLALEYLRQKSIQSHKN